MNSTVPTKHAAAAVPHFDGYELFGGSPVSAGSVAASKLAIIEFPRAFMWEFA